MSVTSMKGNLLPKNELVWHCLHMEHMSHLCKEQQECSISFTAWMLLLF